MVVVIMPKNYFISMSLVSVKTWLSDKDKEKRKSHTFSENIETSENI